MRLQAGRNSSWGWSWGQDPDPAPSPFGDSSARAWLPCDGQAGGRGREALELAWALQGWFSSHLNGPLHVTPRAALLIGSQGSGGSLLAPTTSSVQCHWASFPISAIHDTASPFLSLAVKDANLGAAREGQGRGKVSWSIPRHSTWATGLALEKGSHHSPESKKHWTQVACGCQSCFHLVVRVSWVRWQEMGQKQGWERKLKTNYWCPEEKPVLRVGYPGNAHPSSPQLLFRQVSWIWGRDTLPGHAPWEESGAFRKPLQLC